MVIKHYKGKVLLLEEEDIDGGIRSCSYKIKMEITYDNDSIVVLALLERR